MLVRIWWERGGAGRGAPWSRRHSSMAGGIASRPAVPAVPRLVPLDMLVVDDKFQKQLLRAIAHLRNFKLFRSPGNGLPFSLSPQATCTWPSSMPPTATSWTSCARAACWRPTRPSPSPTAPPPRCPPSSCSTLLQMWPGAWTI